jgi:DNA-binding NarL/FixJ family response regulator
MQEDMEIVGEAENGTTAVKIASSVCPDIVIMDVSMPDMSGMEATRTVISAVPNAKVIALSMHSDRRFVVGMFEAGVKGYVLKHGAFDELAGAIRAVSENKSYLSPGISDIVAKSCASGQIVKHNSLSDREQEILKLIAEGRSVREISEVLYISSSTVDTHRRNIIAKLNLNNTASMIRYALREEMSGSGPFSSQVLKPEE